MFDWYYMKDVEKFLDSDHYTVWKFPASTTAYEKQSRPLVYSYSIMTRAYGTSFNDDNMITYFNNEGFDVYLVDWGKNSVFTLKGWDLNDLTGCLEKDVILPLLQKYNVKKLNVFGVCIGGVLLSHLISQNKDIGKKLHRVAYYGVPILGARDLGMQKTFCEFYNVMKPYEKWFKDSGLSLFFLDNLILYSGSMSMLNWTWAQYFKENANNSLANILNWTVDDRWVPFSALMKIIETGFEPETQDQEFHFNGETSHIHFLNIVGKDDMLVKPSASIIEWNSPIPPSFHSFRQIILNTDHFMFARPGFKEEKQEIAQWFAGYDFSAMIHKLRTKAGEQFSKRAVIVQEALVKGFKKATRAEKDHLRQALKKLLGEEKTKESIESLATRFKDAAMSRKNSKFFEQVSQNIAPVIEKSPHRREKDINK